MSWTQHVGLHQALQRIHLLNVRVIQQQPSSSSCSADQRDPVPYRSMTLLMGHTTDFFPPSPALFGCKTATSFLPCRPCSAFFLVGGRFIASSRSRSAFLADSSGGWPIGRPACQKKDSSDRWMSASVAATYGPFRLHETPFTRLSTTTPRCSGLHPTQSTAS